MKKQLITLGSIIVAMALLFVVQSNIALLDPKLVSNPDSRPPNSEALFTRSRNWEQVAETTPIFEHYMAIIDGSTYTTPITAELFRQFYGYSDKQIGSNPVARHTTTHSAYINLIDGNTRPNRDLATSLILVAAPSQEEKAYAASKGVELEIVPVAMDSLVFITHKNNPVDSLTIEQIQDIYSGKITNWKQVGGEDLSIIPYQCDQNSSIQVAMEEMVMLGGKMMVPPTKQVNSGPTGKPVDVASEYLNSRASIGYTYNSYTSSYYQNLSIKVIKIDGVAPTDGDFISEDYPFVLSYYVVIKAGERFDAPAKLLRDFLVSPNGQDLIAMAGYGKVGD